MARWGKEEVKELVMLGRARSSVDALAERFDRGPRAFKAKLKCVGIYLATSKVKVTAPLEIPEKLPDLQEVLKVVAATTENHVGWVRRHRA